MEYAVCGTEMGCWYRPCAMCGTERGVWRHRSVGTCSSLVKLNVAHNIVDYGGAKALLDVFRQGSLNLSVNLLSPEDVGALTQQAPVELDLALGLQRTTAAVGESSLTPGHVAA
mmetsp:Transcript_20607/g.31493  ORF Transcript_20607/g.31493 Transcript_20607/m.31493 type:complete len:114 (+) Transcript_20607:223-564(+)